MSSATACLHVSRASEHEKTFLIPFSGISSPPAQIVLWYFQSLMVTKIDNFYIIQFPSDDQIYCEEEDLIFDRSIVSQSLIQTFGFVCDRLDSSIRDVSSLSSSLSRSSLRTYYNAIYMLGMLFGSYLFGWYSDNFGRLNALMLSVLTISLSGFFG